MNCPKCDSPKIRVVRTQQATPETVIRDRKCKVCKVSWVTVERKRDAASTAKP